MCVFVSRWCAGRDKSLTESTKSAGDSTTKLTYSADFGESNFKAALGNLELIRMEDDDKDKMIQRLQSELQIVQRAHQDSMNRSAILSSQTAALQEQLMLAGDREKDMRAR